jgi:PAS domain S-box-containing protein
MNPQELRKLAEALLSRGAAALPPLAAADLPALLHELHVCHGELATQNEALRAAQRRYQYLFEHAPGGYVLLDRMGLVVQANRAFAALVGAEPAACVGQPLAAFLAPAGHRAFFEQLRRGLAEPGPRVLDLAGRRGGADGPELVVTLLAWPDAVEGQPLVLAAVQDGTDRGKAERALRQCEARLRALLEMVAEAVFTVNDVGLVEALNPAAEQLFGPAAEVVGRKFVLLLAELCRADVTRRLAARPGERVPRTRALPVVALRRDGTAFAAELTLGDTGLAERRLVTALLREAARPVEVQSG